MDSSTELLPLTIARPRVGGFEVLLRAAVKDLGDDGGVFTVRSEADSEP
jgi:hypothetical protein